MLGILGSNDKSDLILVQSTMYSAPKSNVRRNNFINWNSASVFDTNYIFALDAVFI